MSVSLCLCVFVMFLQTSKLNKMPPVVLRGNRVIPQGQLELIKGFQTTSISLKVKSQRV